MDCWAEDRADTFRVITYNVQFLPEPVSANNERPEPEYRAKRIAEEVSRFDIIGLQETFHKVHRGMILDELKRHWQGDFQQVVSPQPEGFHTSGGCLIATQFKLIESGAMVYKNFSKPADYGLRADGHAAKGVIHARLTWGDDSGRQLDVFVTHMEARDDDLRPRQYGEMAAFIKERRDATLPALVMGDMNTRGAKEFRADASSQYSQLWKQLDSVSAEGEVIDVWPTLSGDALGGTNKQESHEIGKRIDYLFVLNPAGEHARLEPTFVDVLLYQDAKVTALSDHNAVVAEFEWQTP